MDSKLVSDLFSELDAGGGRWPAWIVAAEGIPPEAEG
jgi:hypothetical protein